MFGWFTSSCPLDTGEKTWTEWRMRWLADQLGIERLFNAQVVLPTEEFFPDYQHGTVEDAERILKRLCGFFAIKAQDIQLEVCADAQLPGAAGHYDRGEQTVIRIAESELNDATRLVATLAHELAHEILLGGGLLTADVADHEWITDLLPVFLGIGIFAANATIYEDHVRDGQLSWWTISKQGYLPARIFGYAFALFSFMRGELDPPWAKYLRPDASTALRGGLRFLRKSNDSLFHPDTIRTKRPWLSPGDLAARLQSESATTRLVTLWEVRERVVTDAEVVAAVSQCLADGDKAVAESAGRALAVMGEAASPAIAQLIRTLSARDDGVRAGAACALGMLRQEPHTVVRELCELLRASNRNLVVEAARALRRFGTQAEPSAQFLLSALNLALVECDYATVDELAGTLMEITSDPESCVHKYFSDHDSEFRERAVEAIEEQRSLARQQETASDDSQAPLPMLSTASSIRPAPRSCRKSRGR